MFRPGYFLSILGSNQDDPFLSKPKNPNPLRTLLGLISLKVNDLSREPNWMIRVHRIFLRNILQYMKSAQQDVLIYFDKPLDDNEAIAKNLLRPELYDILQQAESIQRFTGLGLLPESIQGETVKTHTLRLISWINDLPITEEIKSACIHTCTIHDLPEVKRLITINKTADTTAVAKALAPDIDQKIEKDENQTAREIFTDYEYQLYENITQASEFLKGRSAVLPTEVGLLSKIIDKSDGDIRYHIAARKNHAKGNKLNEKAQKLAFEQYSIFSEKLDQIGKREALYRKGLPQNILNNAMFTIQDIWSVVPSRRLPTAISICLRNFQIHRYIVE